MQAVDRVEKRRFIGREYVLWLWFESEVRGGTFESHEAQDVGLWPAAEAVFSAAKESTRIKGEAPVASREAKEALLLGKTPEKMGFRVVVGEREFSLALKGDTLAINALKLPTVLGEEVDALTAMGPQRGPKRGPKTTVAQDVERVANDKAEQFYERMVDTREIESVLETLYARFLKLRLSERWGKTVAPALQDWLSGRDVDAEAYLQSTQERSARRG